ncbi:MAG: alpha/beta hydrolase [Clostridia bacterium]|nr:alpha/beta hydrolase [Clostridia bacterium]
MKYEKLHLKDFFPKLGDNGCDPTVEIYLPYNISEMKWEDRKRPCIVICPGGGYRFCSQRESEPIALKFLPEGYNVFVITYSTRLHCFPTQLREVAALMELIYSKAEEWNCDTTRILIGGFSAGGHLAAHYSTMYDCKEVREMFPDSKPVNGSILSYPVITADPKHSHAGSFTFLTGRKTPTEEDINYFSCDRNVKENTPPAFIWHTAADGTVPVMNSILYATALSKYKIPFELHIYPHGGHGLSSSDSQACNGASDPTLTHVSGWLEALKKWLKYMNFSDK